MLTHDIIANRNEKLVNHINRILSSTDAAPFAVGYFFMSGLMPGGRRLKNGELGNIQLNRVIRWQVTTLIMKSITPFRKIVKTCPNLVVFWTCSLDAGGMGA